MDDGNIEYQIGMDEMAIEQMFVSIDELDMLEELSMESKTSTGMFDISLEAMGSDKFLHNIQKGRTKFYGDFIKTNTRMYANLTAWLRKEEIKKTHTLASLQASKGADKKELGKVVAKKMNGKNINIISLLNGIDPKQVKLAKIRFDNLKSRVKDNTMFINKISKMIQKGSGFNLLLDDKLEPSDLVSLIKEQYDSEPDLSPSVNSIRLFGVQRRFKTDKRQILVDMMKQEGAKTILLDWSGSTMKYLLITGTELKVIYKKLKLTNGDYTSFYQRNDDIIKKTISDNSGTDHLIEQMRIQLNTYQLINNSLLKLYMPSEKTYDELKYIRRFHMNLVRVMHLRLMDIVSSYRVIYSIANIIDKELT